MRMKTDLTQSNIQVEYLLKASIVTLLMSDNNISKLNVIKFLIRIDIKRMAHNKFGFPPYRINMNIWREDNDSKIFYAIQESNSKNSSYNDWLFLTKNLTKEDLRYYVNELCNIAEDIAKKKKLLNKRGLVYQLEYAINPEKKKINTQNLFS